ncbi:MAG: serine/threonine protein kinase [Muribaculaceae bacterium]|nr:serine/threonine protein kinase [Muribaculaceae bacterium]
MNDTSGFDITGIEFSDSGYHILRLVHESETGFCRILEVKHNGRLYIAKSLKPEYRNSTVHLEFLKREYEIISTLYHPSIIQAYGIETIPGEGPALILEYAHGITLQSYIDSKEITTEIANEILKQICDAVDYCHNRQIIHRDLKPSNIVVYPTGPIIKLIDFNFSYSPSFTDPPLPGGTKGFSAPEQFHSGSDAIPAADIWSIGKIMQAMLPDAKGNWRRVADQCMNTTPELRPVSAKQIPELLKKRGIPKRLSTISIIASLVLIVGFLFLIFSDQQNKGISYNSSSDIQTSANSNISRSENNRNEDSIIDVTQKNPDDHYQNLEEFSNKEIGSTPINIKSEQKDSLNKVSNTKIPESIIAEAKNRAEKAAAIRFKEQISILDTVSKATSAETIYLAKVGHWRWKAKQDVEKWIKTLHISESEKTNLAAIVKDVVGEYDKAHHSEFKKAMHDAAFSKGVIWVFNTPETLRKPIGNNEYEKEVLGEDGVWHKVIEKGSSND